LAEETPVRVARGSKPYKRIATEEGFCPPELLKIYRDLIENNKVDDPAFNTMFGFYLDSPSARVQQINNGLVSVDEFRLGQMDDAGIDTAILSLTSPGVQVMDKDDAISFAAFANDWLVEKMKANADRFEGLTAVAPQDPAAAAREIQRGHEMGLKGVIINSHTKGEYLDDEKFWEIFEAAEALDTPIYLHPQTPPKKMSEPFLERGLDGAIYGFAVETALHMLRIFIAGVFDRFPKLTMVIGHNGESLPFWLYRLDYMHRAGVVSERYESMKPLKRTISEYMRDNVYITNSGVAWEPGIKFCQQVLGVDRVLYAMDYPYQYEPAEVAKLDEMDMPDEDKKKFFQSNAEKVFKL
jgi:2,3-dihydroxybenzoate decarboxylase